MAKGGAKKGKVAKSAVSEATQAAVDEAMHEIEDGLLDEEQDDASFEPQTDSLDVFEEGHRRAKSLNDTARYVIKKNSQFLCTRDYPYSWEHLQKEFGPGYYQVFAKRRSNGHILKQQSEEVATSPEFEAERKAQAQTQQTQSEGTATLALVQQFQERAEERARQDLRSNESSLATIMQSIAQSQQKSTEMMMTMFMESAKQTQNLMLTMMQQNQNKGSDPVMTLLTTMLTKDKPQPGMSFEQVIKLLQDKERDTRQAIEKQYEMIEKKSEALAQVKAEALTAGEGGEDEGGLAGLAKGFIPILAQLAANKQNLTPEQQVQMQMLEQRRQAGQHVPENFMPDAQNRPAIPAPQHMRRPRPPQGPGGPRASNPGVQNRSAQVDPMREQPASQPQAMPKEVQVSKDPEALSRLKERILAVSGLEVVQGRAQGHKSSDVAERCLIGLEKEGISRQTVANTFKLEDFHQYAAAYGVTLSAEDEEWMKEFYEYVQISSRPVVAKVASAEIAVHGPPAPTGAHGHGVNGSGGKPTTVIEPRAGTRARGSAKNIPERNI